VPPFHRFSLTEFSGSEFPARAAGARPPRRATGRLRHAAP
jgi:hypothetical protein